MERRLDKRFYIPTYNKTNDLYDIKENTLLLVIDIQPRLMKAMENGEVATANAITLIEAFKEYDMHIVATEQYPKGLGSTDERILEAMGDVPIYDKTIFDAAIPEVMDYIRENNIENVVIVGAEGHVCVYQTVRSLRDFGLNVFLAEDAVASFKESQKQTAANAMRDMDALVVNTEMILFDLARHSKDPHFKAISALVKEARDRG